LVSSANEPYCGWPPTPAAIAASWNNDAVLLVALSAAVLFGLRVNKPDRLAWWGGIAGLAIVFVSPLCALASALFAARGLHHLLVAAVVAPLLAVALPRLRSPAIAPALALSSLALWLWHWPALYEAAYHNHLVYWALQILLLTSFVWFWRAVLSPSAPALGAVLAIGAGAGQMGLLGALLTLAPRPLYEVHGSAALLWGLDPLQDQQLAGLLMWVPAFFVYGAYAIVAAHRVDRLAFE
jgi:putative membrane protein